jgi:hypothetical protein
MLRDVTGPTPTPTPTTPSTGWQSPGDQIYDAHGNSMRVGIDVAETTGLVNSSPVEGTDKEKFAFSPVGFLGIAAADAGVAGLMGAWKAHNVGNLSLGTTAAQSVDTWAVNKKRMTPTLVSAIAGPGVADAVSMIAPNVLPKYKKELPASEKKKVQVLRAAIGGVAVAAVAAGVFLLKPNLFKGAGFFSEAALQGLSPMVDAAGATLRNSRFTTQLIGGALGGVAGLVAANRWIGDDDASIGEILLKTGGAVAAGATAGTLLGTAISRTNMPQVELFAKPNMQWFKEYATKIVPLTGIPAGTAASQYFSIVDDFEKITSPRSPFAK